MIKINLLREPSAKKQRRAPSVSRLNLIALGVSVVLLGAVFLWYYVLASQLDEMQARARELRVEQAELAQVNQQMEMAEERKRVLQERVALIERLRSNQRGPIRLMNHLLRAIPTDPKLWLTSLVQQEGVVAIEGRSFDVPSIADFIRDLDRGSLFQQVELEFWEDQQDSIKFKLNCRIGE